MTPETDRRGRFSGKHSLVLFGILNPMNILPTLKKFLNNFHGFFPPTTGCGRRERILGEEREFWERENFQLSLQIGTWMETHTLEKLIQTSPNTLEAIGF